MRRLFDKLTATLSKFVAQRDDLLLLIPCNDSDFALVLKALRDLDRASASDLFLLFAADFQDPKQFLTAMAQSQLEEWTLVNGAVPEEERLPPLPAAWLDPEKPPPARLVAGLEYGRSLIDPRKGQRYIWAMGPSKIENPAGYIELLATLPPQPNIVPWMRGARVIARVSADFKLDRSPLAKCKRVRVEPFAIPHDIFDVELAADAVDPQLPVSEKMKAEVQLGYLDYAHSRFDKAVDRFNKSLAFFQWAGVPAMEGLILCGMGDIERRKGNLKKANHWYLTAIEPTVKANNQFLLATVVQNLGAIAFQEKRFADAEERYSELTTLKRALIDEVGVVESLEWQGNSQEKQNAYDRAVVCWEEAALICKAFEMKDRLAPMLTSLKRGYQRLDMREELANFDAEWNA